MGVGGLVGVEKEINANLSFQLKLKFGKMIHMCTELLRFLL